MSTPVTRAAIEAALAEPIGRAREAWPGVDVPVEAVVDLVATRLASSGEAPAASLQERLAQMQVADLYLACGCARGDAAALRAFEQRYFTAVAPALARMGASGLVDEVKQILREKWFVAAPGRPPRILDLAGNGDLGGLVHVAAIRTALKLRRFDERVELVDRESMLDALAPHADPELALVKEQHRAELKRAVGDAVASLSPRGRNVLKLHLVHGLSIDEIGRAHGVHRATAARWLERVREELQAETRRLLRQRLGLDGAEMESVVRLVESRLEVSFRRLLTDA